MLGSYSKGSKQQHGHQDEGAAGQQSPPLTKQREEKESGCDKPFPRQQPSESAAPAAITSVIDIEIDRDDNDENIELTFTTCSQDVEALLINEFGKLNTTSQEQEGLASTHDDLPSSNDFVVTNKPSTASTPIEEEQPLIATPITPDSSHKITVTTASSSYPASTHSTTSSITDSRSDMSTTHKAYQQYKRTKSRSQCLSNENSLHEIIEDIQFCSMYFMKELFGEDDEDEVEGDNQKKISKVERVKETNESFLGKMIQCTSTSMDGNECSVHISRDLDLSTTTKNKPK